MTVATHEVTCPREDCAGTIRVPADLPAGVYDCLCRASRLRLSWATFADFTRRPMLRVEPQEETP